MEIVKKDLKLMKSYTRLFLASYFIDLKTDVETFDFLYQNKMKKSSV